MPFPGRDQSATAPGRFDSLGCRSDASMWQTMWQTMDPAMTHLLRDDDGMTIYVSCPAAVRGENARLLLAGFYHDLLGWPMYEAYGDSFLARKPKFRLGFMGTPVGWSDRRPPRWPDPDYPQQAHLDILVPEGGAYGKRVMNRGAILLQDYDAYQIYADPVGHPFCLYPEPSRTADGPVVARLVLDCFSPRSLATFYEGLLGAREARVEDSPARVVINLGDEDLPNLAFQQAPPRDYHHPDPDYPAQLHVDYRFPDQNPNPAAVERAELLGAIHIPTPTNATYADPAGHPFCV